MTISRAMGALTARYQVALPVLPRQRQVIRGRHLEPKYGGKRHGLQRLFGQVLVSGKSSVKLCSAGIADY